MIKKQFEEITEWQKTTFPNATPQSKIAHLEKEVPELKEALVRNDGYEVAMEFADCFFLLFGAAHAAGLSYDDIVSAIELKFLVNKTRQWGKPDAEGVVEHIKE